MSYKIAVIPGDGTGPEVVAEGLKCLRAVSEKVGFKYELTRFDFGGERYKRTGETLPDSALEEFRKFDAIYLGAIGHPDVKPGILEKGILLRTRFELDQYINLRPVKLYPGVDCPLKDKGPEEIDFVVVRENTEGLYTGSGGFLKKGTPDEIAVQESINTRKGVERCLRYAFELTRRRGKNKKLTLCGKTNVLTFAFDLWERTFHEVGERDYPDVQRDYAHVDATCMWMVKNPEWFDVIVTDNMFGDIITDLGAMIQGGDGGGRRGEHQPGGDLDVRADRGVRAEVHRPECDQPGRGHRGLPDDDRRAGGGEGRKDSGGGDHRGGEQEAEEHVRGQDGLLHQPGGGPGGRGGGEGVRRHLCPTLYRSTIPRSGTGRRPRGSPSRSRTS